MSALREEPSIDVMLVHTGQHYDEKMADLFFDELHIPKPDINLNVGSGSHATQTAAIMMRFEPVMMDFMPDYVLVVGDVNSTIACGLVAVKLGVRLIHIEAGLRSFDRTMPEEINRILTDSISDMLFVSEPSGIANLMHEGINPSKIHFVGNVMIDTLLANKEKAEQSDVLDRLGIVTKQYAVITLHRPENVDKESQLTEIIRAIEQIGNRTTFVFPLHPRTRSNLEKMGLMKRLCGIKHILFTEPLGYLDFVCLMKHSRTIMTDSGGVQEEATILNIPCITLRKNTERPATITHGTNRLVPVTTSAITQSFLKIIRNGKKGRHGLPELWDGKAAKRIVEIMLAKHNEMT